ncbi:MAG: ABC transporter, permease protein [Pseudolabrys sp.]|jgi:NitT/TauT family transport system permease protein|nr:ABC transporter, permease protein [Pseudolabrys sp.]
MRGTIPISVEQSRRVFTRWDILAVLLVLGFLVFVGEASRHLLQPLTELQATPLSLSPARLPEYAARTTLRMLVALVLSLVFTFTYATLAAKNKRAELLLVPLLDILQSVPILGFISVTVVFFMALAPGRVLGAEFAAVFAIFTSQAWNMAFSFYQSLRTVPEELLEASRVFRLSRWMQFWRVEVPFAMPQLIWNMMVSMSGSWFFVVASEAISVGNTTVTLPGIGSYIAQAIALRDLSAVFWAIVAMLVVILLYDQLLFRPLVAWADRFRFEQQAGVVPPQSWVLDMLRRSGIVAAAVTPLGRLWRRSFQLSQFEPTQRASLKQFGGRWGYRIWAACVAAFVAYVAWRVVTFISGNISLAEFGDALLLGLATLTRVVVLIALATIIWLPLGIIIGMRPRLAQRVQPIAQFLAAFPANVLFPVAVSAIVALKLDPNVWLSPLMILGTQWYILFNVVAGAASIPSEMRDVSTNLQVRGWLWWRRVAIPAVFPYYVTGAITASGGSWNASIVAEVANWGSTKLKAYGLGAYIAQATDAGDFPRIVLGVAVMSLYVVVINRIFWRPLYRYAERKFRLE